VVRLTALVCVQNQEAQLAECLRSLSFCDEIVVVADRCTDRSQEIARCHGATVIDGIFPLESQRKAAGLDACGGEWILELDADERIDRALAWEIRAVLQMRPLADCYEIPIDNYVGEARVRDGWLGQLSASRGVRLFKRGLKVWAPLRRDDGHAAPGCRVCELKGAIHRDLGTDVGGLFERMNRLTALAAEDLADSAAARPRGQFLGAAGKFAQSYLLRAGWREGRLGLLVALLNAIYPVVSRMRALEVMEARRATQADASQPAWLREVVGLSR
jgi:glycosyltransferase involved in cell wall biosynthesis